MFDRDIENPEQLIAPQKREVADSVIMGWCPINTPWDQIQNNIADGSTTTSSFEMTQVVAVREYQDRRTGEDIRSEIQIDVLEVTEANRHLIASPVEMGLAFISLLSLFKDDGISSMDYQGMILDIAAGLEANPNGDFSNHSTLQKLIGSLSQQHSLNLQIAGIRIIGRDDAKRIHYDIEFGSDSGWRLWLPLTCTFIDNFPLIVGYIPPSDDYPLIWRPAEYIPCIETGSCTKHGRQYFRDLRWYMMEQMWWHTALLFRSGVLPHFVPKSFGRDQMTQHRDALVIDLSDVK